MQVLRQSKRCGMNSRIVVSALKTGLMEAGLNNFGGKMT